MGNTPNTFHKDTCSIVVDLLDFGVEEELPVEVDRVFLISALESL